MLSACKRAEAPDEADGGEPGGPLVLRLYNPTRREQPVRISLRGGIARARAASILEAAREELPLADGGLDFTLPASKIVTLLVEPSIARG